MISQKASKLSKIKRAATGPSVAHEIPSKSGANSVTSAGANRALTSNIQSLHPYKKKSQYKA